MGGETFMIVSQMDVEALAQAVHCKNKESSLKMLLVWDQFDEWSHNVYSLNTLGNCLHFCFTTFNNQ